jgi:hypothetical protein
MAFRWLLVAGFCLQSLAACAGQLAGGDAVPAFAANDQHGKEFVFTNGVRFLLVATERAVGTSANHKLAEQGAGSTRLFLRSFSCDTCDTFIRFCQAFL